MSVAQSIAISTSPPLTFSADALKHFSAAEYHALIQQGVFTEDDDFELLEGLIVRKMTINPPHWIATGNLRDALIALGIPGYFVHSQEPVTIQSGDSSLSQDSEPEPDVAFVRGSRRDYVQSNPDPQKTPLVVEVADSTLDRDRTWKKRIYARGAVPIYWIVNLIDRQIEVYTRPSGPASAPDYAGREVLTAMEEVPVIVDGREIGRLKVKDILP